MNTYDLLQPIIQTRHYEATGGGRERVVARWGDKQVVVLWRSELTSYHNHCRAANRLADKYGLKGVWLVAPRNDHSWVFIEKATASEISFFPWGGG